MKKTAVATPNPYRAAGDNELTQIKCLLCYCVTIGMGVAARIAEHQVAARVLTYRRFTWDV